MSRVAILYGGRSGEHEVSRKSAAAVLNNLSKKHEILLIGISLEGRWYLHDLPGQSADSLDLKIDPSKLISILPGEGLRVANGGKLEVDVVLPILHGSFGEDGTVQGLLENARVAYAGSGVLGSAVGMDKELCKRIWKQAGLSVVPWITVHRGAPELNYGNLWKACLEELGSPIFVKPANAGSSVGVSKVEDSKDLQSALESAWRYDRKVLLEKAVIGREIECSVMGYDNPRAFPPGEIVPMGSHDFYDYDAKYIDPDGAQLQVPAVLPEHTTEEIQNLAVKAYRAVEAGGLSRVDFLLDGVSGGVFINEINTLPGMTSISLFPRMAAAGGVDFTEMLEQLIDGALREHEYREGLSYRR